MASLEDIPDNFYVGQGKILRTSFTWLNQGRSIEDWVHHICSTFRCERYEAVFHITKITYDMQSLRNTFPKFEGIYMRCFADEPSDHDIQNAQNILRAFLPYVENVRLSGVPLKENLYIQHIGMANLKEFNVESRNPKFDDILTWNVKCCTINAHRFSFRDLNCFFKLWKKGSNPKLKCLLVHGLNIPDWNVLMKGLQEEEAERQKEYTIQNCYGIRAKITSHNVPPILVCVEFTVSN
ncbi:hypothetical protein B9Z55_011248 [Caenorhabditis nigoni]|uniref:Sdz-33 F-box domain-containing protein n=1 Tax=Caenorhabditis nigoni TaxID=1611254 RepID=A0A2G5UJB6_9PELO|nr:hypothetical protein B9Z55_011248 [Caenorhabditis nigoni]